MSRPQDCLPPTSSVRRQFDAVQWSQTDLGPQDGWQPSLRVITQAALCCDVPMVVAWGPQLTMLYNDAYAVLLGRRHPQALGQPYASVWPEVWDAVRPDLQRALAGCSTSHRNVSFVLERNGPAEQTYWDYAMSPLRDESDVVRGVLAVFNETTRRVLASQARQSQLQEFGRLMEQAPNYLAMVSGAQHRYRSASKAYRDLLGVDALVGRSFAQCPLPSADGDLAGELDAAYASGTRREIRRVRCGAAVVDIVLQPLRDPAGQVEGLLIVGTDVTLLEHAQSELRQSEALLRALVHGMPHLVWAVDAEGLEGFHNERWIEFLGVDPKSLDVELWLERIHPDDRAGVGLAWEQARQSWTPYQAEYRLRHASGDWRWVLARGLPVSVPGSGPGRWVGTVTDIHATKTLEIQLRDAKHRLEATLEAAEVGTWVWDVADNTVRADANMALLHNMSPQDAAETPMASFCASAMPEDVPEIQRRLARTLQSGEPFDATYRVPQAGGGVRHIHNRGKLIRENGKLWLPGICIDVTAHKDSEARLASLNARKDRFLAVLAHELRNPLAPIVTAAELLSQTPVPGPDLVSQLAGVLQRQSAQLAHLVDDLLDVARINSGKVVLGMAACDVRDVVSRALEQVWAQAQSRRMRVTIDLGKPAMVRADAARLVQVVANLLVNAIRCTPEEGAIHVRLQTEGDQAVLRVEDTGKGLDPDDLERVFELFAQGDDPSGDRASGLGLGLSLVRSLVELHGGRVNLYSAGRGQGCEAVVRLPLLGAGVPPPAGSGPDAAGEARD